MRKADHPGQTRLAPLVQCRVCRAEIGLGAIIADRSTPSSPGMRVRTGRLVGYIAAKPTRASPSQAVWRASRSRTSESLQLGEPQATPSIPSVLRRVAPTTTSADFSLQFVTVTISGTRRHLPGKNAILPCTASAFRSPGVWPQELCSHMPARPGRRRVECNSCTSTRGFVTCFRPRSVALTQLHFTCLDMASLAGDMHRRSRPRWSHMKNGAKRPRRLLRLGLAISRSDGDETPYPRQAGPRRRAGQCSAQAP